MPLAPAPPRGRYDRSLSRQTRNERQRERLLAATTHVLGQVTGEPSVTDIVRVARVGRNTFYEHFDNLDDAVAQANTRAADALRSRLGRSGADAWTPRERLRSALGAWLDFVVEEPTVARALLRQPSRASHFALSRAGDVLRETLQRLVEDAVRDAVVSTPPEAARLVAVTAAVEAIGRMRLEQPWTRADHASLAVDLVVRAFR